MYSQLKPDLQYQGISSVKFHRFMSSSSLINCKIIIAISERGTKVNFKSLILMTWLTETRMLNLPPDYQ